ncbi:MAG: hypothetical protein BRC28_00760 [Nanohaloarchaea archaeon SW_4_43_9]|nr:MAG: hypothetical protein BRC28_00760 [Nanohaloarchaea archaeon SW_4_43_9]
MENFSTFTVINHGSQANTMIGRKRVAFHLNNNRKGISPLIAAVLLIAFSKLYRFSVEC